MIRFCLLSFLASLVASGCSDESGRVPSCPCSERSLRIATTTSVENTGLLDKLLPVFSERTGISVSAVAVGTGQALALARNGDADLVLVHDPDAERRFIEEGFGVNPRLVMHNDLIIIGPKTDPAGLRGGRDAKVALKKLRASGAPFVSRGDESGTHRAELRLWAGVVVLPDWDAYAEAGQGMRMTLNMANERQAYCLTDRATWLFSKDKLDLGLMVEGDPLLFNRYTVIPVNPVRYKDLNYTEAMAFVGWLTGPEAQRLIGDFRVKGRQLFVPDAVPGEAK